MREITILDYQIDQSLFYNITQWGIDKNIVGQVPLINQLKKTMEEIMELIQAINNCNHEDIKDAIGDTLITLILAQAINNCDIVNYDTNERFCILVNLDKGKFDNHTDVIDALIRDLKLINNAIARIDYDKNIKISIGNIIKTAVYFDYSINRCLSIAYDEIKNRKGEIVNGIFVKEE